jgi:hypothetical protein
VESNGDSPASHSWTIVELLPVHAPGWVVVRAATRIIPSKNSQGRIVAPRALAFLYVSCE